MQYVEDRQIGAPWRTALAMLTLFLGACAVLVWLAFLRDLARHLQAPPPPPSLAERVAFVLAGEPFVLPRGAVRFPSPALIAGARGQPVAADRIEIELGWPASGPDGTAGGRIDVTLEARSDPVGLRARFERLDRPRIETADAPAPPGLVAYRHGPDTRPLREETLYVLAEESGLAEPFVLRCAENAGGIGPATCYRAVTVAPGVRLEYRYEAGLLPHWRAIEARIRAFVALARGPA